MSLHLSNSERVTVNQKIMFVLEPLSHLEDYVLRNIRILESSDWKGPERSSILKCPSNNLFPVDL